MQTYLKTIQAAVLSWLLLLLCDLPTVTSIGCFICSSVNGSNPACEDTFNNTEDYYHQPCYAGRKGRSGTFPGTQCIKMTAKLDEAPYSIIVRDCVVDNGEINSETEIGRSTHCGLVQTMVYDDKHAQGCILSCNTDGCNDSNALRSSRALNVLSVSILVSLWIYSS